MPKGNKVPYTELSDIQCSNKGCGRKLKVNLIMKKGDKQPLKCFKCYQLLQKNTSNPIVTAKDARRNPRLRSLKRAEKFKNTMHR